MSMSADDCYKKTYVKFKYVPPVRTREPLNCAAIHFTESPALGFPDDYKSIDLVCHAFPTEGAGGIILLLQVKTSIMWKMGFIDTAGTFTTESHRIDVSMPMLYEISGPMLALRLVVKGLAKAISFMPSIASVITAMKNLHDMQRVMAKVLSFHKGFCPEDVKALELGLKVLETQIGDWWRNAAYHSSPHTAFHRLGGENFAALVATSPFGRRFCVTGLG